MRADSNAPLIEMGTSRSNVPLYAAYEDFPHSIILTQLAWQEQASNIHSKTLKSMEGSKTTSGIWQSYKI